MLKIAIVGCGKIADWHASQIQRIKGCEIAGVCDREHLMARQLHERFPVKHWYSDLGRLLSDLSPDVVHITTPPQTHFEFAMQCVERGCKVYVEKPFTLYEDEARSLIAAAEKRGLKVTAGHDDQFSHAPRRMRAIIQSGFLGSAPYHMESHYGYELGRSGYAGALLNDRSHWVRGLPGKLLHNVISHGIARIAEFLTGGSIQVMADGFASPLLKSMGESDIMDELRVLIHDEQGSTAYFTFSSQIRPLLHQFRILGAKNGLALDQDEETVIKLPGARYKSYAEKFIPPVLFAKQYLGNAATNLRSFLRRDFHVKSDRKSVVESFYR